MIWKVPAIVRSVWDGDTFHADLDLGWKIWRLDQRVRIQNFTAPELKDPGGIEARDALGLLLPAGTAIRLTSTKLDQYGRTLALVTLPDGRDLALALGAP